MSTIAGPLADLHRQLDEIIVRSDLSAPAKIAKLREMRDDFTRLSDTAEQYIADSELLREAESFDLTEAVMYVRQNAAIREQLIKRGMVDAEKLDELGYLGFEELDRLQEEGRLIEWASSMQEAVNFDPRLHPRDRSGRFRDILGKLSPGKTANLPHGVKVTRQEGGGYSIHHKNIKGGQQGAASARVAAERALKHVDKEAGARPAPPSVPIKGRKGGTVPPHIHSAGQMEQDAALQGADPDEFIDVGGDIEMAAQLLSEGKKVRLDQPREVSTLIDKLGEMAQTAKERGEKAPIFDLCSVTVKGTNLFCVESKGIERVKMPQLTGNPDAGSRGDSLPRDSRGNVDLTEQFKAHLTEMGIQIEPGHEKASYMRASQRELNGVKVAGIMGALEGGTVIEGSMFISRDGYIVDGHHRWAAEVGRDMRDNVAGDVTMQVERIDMDIGTLLDEANAFAAEWGMPQQGVAQSAHDVGAGAGKDVEDGPGKDSATDIPSSGESKTAFGTPWVPQLDQPIPPDSLADHYDSLNLEDPTDEEVQQALAKAQEIGLNDWPEKGEAATKILGESKDTQELFTSGSSTSVGKAADGSADYIRERRIFHDQAIDVLLRERNPDGSLNPHGAYIKPPADGKPTVLFMGGGTASGKTTALELPENEGVQPEQAVRIDVDEIKSMKPEYQDMVKAGEKYAAYGVHEESSDVAKRLQVEAMKLGLNVIVDGTGNTKVKQADPANKDKLLNKMREFKGDEKGVNAHGGPAYVVQGFYVNAGPDLGVVRATGRAIHSGRWVPEPTIRDIFEGVSERFKNDIQAAIDEGTLTHLRGYDTAKRKPRPMFHLDDSGKLVVLDQELYDRFLAQGGESEP